MTSIFGNLDINDQLEINDDPFWIQPGTYKAVCLDCIQKTHKDGTLQCVITWAIDEPANEYHGQKRQEYYGLFPEREKWEDYTAEEKQTTKWFRKRLREGFDLSQQELATVKFSELIGKYAYITLTETEGKENTANAGKKFINVTNALCQRLYDEQNEANNAAATSMGL
jgi:hypothetical protein